MPSEFLKLDASEFQFVLLTATIGTENEAKLLERSRKKNRGK